MYKDKITLTMQDILEKEFKIDARGYRLQEVDKFLDIIIKDYNEYNNIIRNLEKEKRALALENQNLKNEARNLRSSIEAARIGEKEITNVEAEIDKMHKRYRDLHIKRLHEGTCNAYAGAIFLDLLSNLERIGDHSTNIAEIVVENNN